MFGIELVNANYSEEFEEKKLCKIWVICLYRRKYSKLTRGCQSLFEKKECTQPKLKYPTLIMYPIIPLNHNDSSHEYGSQYSSSSKINTKH